MADEAQDLLRDFRATRSPTIRQALAQSERDFEATKARLQQLRERRERLATPFVVQRLNILRDELKRGQFDVAAAHRALLTAVDRIVLRADAGCIELHWRDSDAMSIVPIMSKHVFKDEKAGLIITSPLE